jgi:hypothetical protein
VIPAQYRAIAAAALAAALLLAGFGAGWTAQGWRKDTALQSLKAEHAQALKAAAETALAETQKAKARETELQNQIEGIADEARQLQAARDAAAADAADARQRMLNAARSAASRCASGSVAAIAGGGQAGQLPGSMSDGDRLLRVLGELDGAAGAYADAADRSRAAGLACERSYNAAREALRPKK